MIPPPVQFIRHGSVPYTSLRDLPVHTKGAFNFNIKDEPIMDGWACLKILLTPGHPQREIIKSRCHLVTRTVGQRYIMLRDARELAFAAQQTANSYLQYGGDQYIDNEKDEFAELFEDEDLATGKVNSMSIPDEIDLEDALDDALQEIEMLKLANYKVSYYNPHFGWKERWPRIGDLVDIPADLHSDWESIEPTVEAIDPDGNPPRKFITDERWMNNQRPMPLGYEPDPDFRTITLYQLFDSYGVGYAEIADRKNRNPWEVAVWKLAEYGELYVTKSIQERFNIFPVKDKSGRWVFTPGRLAKFVKQMHSTRFNRDWVWKWITSSIRVTSVEDNHFTQRREKAARQQHNPGHRFTSHGIRAVS